MGLESVNRAGCQGHHSGIGVRIDNPPGWGLRLSGRSRGEDQRGKEGRKGVDVSFMVKTGGAHLGLGTEMSVQDFQQRFFL